MCDAIGRFVDGCGRVARLAGNFLVLRSEPPTEGATLTGWVALAEWMTPGGERMLVLMGKPEASLLQMKAYLHSGLSNMVWKVYGQPDKISDRDGKPDLT